MAYNGFWVRLVPVIVQLYRDGLSATRISFELKECAETIFRLRYGYASPYDICSPSMVLYILKCEGERVFPKKPSPFPRHYTRGEKYALHRPINMGGLRDQWVTWTPESNAAELEEARRWCV